MNIYGAAVVTVVFCLAGPALCQPTTGEQDMAAKLNCSDFKPMENGAWSGKDGKSYPKSDHTAIALQQKCAGGKK